MIENFNDFLSIGSLVCIVFACIWGFYKLNQSFKKNEEVDEYYRDLL